MSTTLAFASASAPNRRFEMPRIPVIPTPCSVSSAMSSIDEMPFTDWLEAVSAPAFTSVPSAEGLNVFFIHIEILADSNGCTVGG